MDVNIGERLREREVNDLRDSSAGCIVVLLNLFNAVDISVISEKSMQRLLTLCMNDNQQMDQ